MSKQQRHCVRYRPALQSKTNHVKPLHSSAEWKRSKFPQADYLPRHNPDFKTVFGIIFGPFSLIKISKTWGTNKQTKKMKISISTTIFGTTSHQLTSFASYTLWWSEGKTVAFFHLQNDVSDDLFLFCPLWGDMQEYQVSVFTFYLYSRFQGSAYI